MLPVFDLAVGRSPIGLGESRLLIWSRQTYLQTLLSGSDPKRKITIYLKYSKLTEFVNAHKLIKIRAYSALIFCKFQKVTEMSWSTGTNMKKNFLILSIFLAVGFLAGRLSIHTNHTKEAIDKRPFQTATPEPRAGFVVVKNTTNSVDGTAVASGEVARVARVIDGDTVELDTGERLRYIGMDTPEVVYPEQSRRMDPRKPVQCFGEESRERNRELVEGKLVVLTKDISEKDRYGRLLRYVWIGSTLVNLELVKEGYATAFTYPPDVAHAKDFVAVERRAREAKRGLWGMCPTKH